MSGRARSARRVGNVAAQKKHRAVGYGAGLIKGLADGVPCYQRRFGLAVFLRRGHLNRRRVAGSVRGIASIVSRHERVDKVEALRVLGEDRLERACANASELSRFCAPLYPCSNRRRSTAGWFAG